MSEYIHMRHGDNSQRDELLEMLDLAFDFTDSDKFINILPKLYKEKYNPAENNVILDVNGEIRAAVGLYYTNLSVCDEKLKIGGIGNVAVHPAHRNKGYMQFCMALCLDEMKQNMTDISFLSGARQRYEHFSYEPGGLEYSFGFNRDNIRRKHGHDKQSVYTYRVISESDSDVLEEITRIHNSKTFKYERTKEDMYDILRTWNAFPYVVSQGEEFKGWFTLSNNKSSVHEVGYKDESDIEEILICALDASDRHSVNIPVPPFDMPLCAYLGKHCEYYRVNHSEQYTILCYENVIRSFLKLKSTYSPLADGECIMLIEGVKLPEQIKIKVKDNHVTVKETTEQPDIVLSHCEAMRLVCSLYSEKRNNLKPECASWFPLPLYTYSSDAV